MRPDPSNLLKRLDLNIPLIGFYDVPDTAGFEPLVTPRQGTHVCVFNFYKRWLKGETLHITRDNAGCGGAAHWLFGVESITREEYVEFLADEEGLKASHELMNEWLDWSTTYRPENPNLLLGPLREGKYLYLKSVTFLVNPDQLSALIIGANYNHEPGGSPRVLAPFGSGCMQLCPLFDDLDKPQAIIGATDLAMRQALPPDILAFTVTRHMFEELCELDEGSFLYKPFWLDLRKSRGLPGL
ncbi:MAG: DUF169 domain-containing protein [Dehalococcoidia bacterium]